MSPLVWTLIDYERLIHFQKKIRTFCYKLSVLVFYHKQAATKLDDSFQLAACYFFMNWATLVFFHSMGNFPLSIHDLKISSKWFKIEPPQIFNIRILIMSKPWALFGLRFLMILAMSPLVNEIVERRLFVLLEESIRNLLEVVVNRATQDTFLSLKVNSFWHFHIPSFESIFVLFMTRKCGLC